MMRLVRAWQDTLTSELLWAFESTERRFNFRLDTMVFDDDMCAERAVQNLMAQARMAACHGLVVGIAGKPRSRLRTKPWAT